jgi:CheY-like chemotaxis protein
VMKVKPNTILIADDDPDDRIMAREALFKAQASSNVIFVEDGEDLMDYLNGRGKYEDKDQPYPDLILLDLNMPKKNGHEALKEIKADTRFRTIPVVVLTTSKEEEDICRTYKLGVNSFITKPVTFESLVNTMKIIGKYWFEIVELPTEKTAG